MKRTLHLRRETLSTLTDDDLTGVVGGAYSGEGRITCYGRECIDRTNVATCGCVDLSNLPTFCSCQTI